MGADRRITINVNRTTSKGMSSSEYFKNNARYYIDKSNSFNLSGTERRDLLLRSSSLHMRYTFPGSRDNLKGLFRFNKNGQMTSLVRDFMPDNLIIQSGIHDFHCLCNKKNANTPCSNDASKDY